MNKRYSNHRKRIIKIIDQVRGELSLHLLPWYQNTNPLLQRNIHAEAISLVSGDVVFFHMYKVGSSRLD